MTSGHFRTLPRAARPPSLFLLASFVALLSGCGSDHVVNTSPPPPPSPSPVTTVIKEGSFSGLGPLEGAVGEFTTARTGTIDVVVDWTFTSNDLDLILAKGSCSADQLVAMQCDVLAVADSTTAKPEKINLANAAAGLYTLFVINFGATEESLSYQVMLTTVGAASEGAVRSSSAAPHIRPAFAKGIPAKVVRLR
jgi:hypothetical protein